VGLKRFNPNQHRTRDFYPILENFFPTYFNQFINYIFNI
jgi:hypothetical protein